MDKKRVLFYFFIIILIVVVFFTFGYIGGKEVERIGASCNLGYHDYCWKWTKIYIIRG